MSNPGKAKLNLPPPCKAFCYWLLTFSVLGNFPLIGECQQSLTNKIPPGGQGSYSRISPPESGVKLLEDIFQRVGSTPQVAIKTNSIKQQAQNLPPPGPTDYRLAIRPKQVGKLALLPSPSLQMLPMAGSSQANSSASAYGVGNSLNTSNVAGSGGQPVAEAWLGNKQFPAVGSESSLRQAAHPGLWENPAYLPPAAADGSLSLRHQETDYKVADSDSSEADVATPAAAKTARPAAGFGTWEPVPGQHVARSVPDLATASARLMGTLNNLEAAQRGASSALQAQDAKKMRSGSITVSARSAKKKAHSLVRSDSAADAVSEDEPVPAGDFMRKRAIAITRISYGGRELALLPPNVVTGIPLIRLGISQAKANNALASMGVLKHQRINKWTVMSWHRPVSKGVTALQLYMHNGLLDAMRIFDSTLIAPDFGINLGDNLVDVKEKFGEPAFILQEPNPGSGQNYIYPISQVGFQFARPAPDQQPRVVSVLIFNVK